MSEPERLRNAFRILFDLVGEVLGAVEWSSSQKRYLVEPEAMSSLLDFIADFHEDNPPLWNLLSKEQQEGEPG